MPKIEQKEKLYYNYNDMRQNFKFTENVIQYYPKISLTPFILSKKQYIKIKNGTRKITRLLSKTIKLYYQDKTIQNFFNLDDRQKYIIESGNKKNKLLFLQRYDGFLTVENEFKFLELNTNFSGGVNRLDEINQTMIKCIGNKDLKNFSNFRKNFITELKKLYTKNKKDGIVAMVYGSRVDKKEKTSFASIAEMLNQNHIKTILCHWKDLQTNKGKNIFYKNQKISIIFRAVLLNRIWEYDYDSAKKVFQSLRCGKIFFLNSPNAYLGGAKSIFALWHSRYFQKYLSKAEIKTISTYIPKTYLVKDYKEKINKNKFVLKPISGYGGEEVIIGKDSSQKKWSNIIVKHKNDYILQEFIKPINKKIVSYNTTNHNKESITANINLNSWLINNKFAGISGRYSESNIINVKQGGGIISVLLKKE